jgi:hypothetical protein
MVRIFRMNGIKAFWGGVNILNVRKGERGFKSRRRGFCLNLDGQDFQDERDKGFWGWSKYSECANRRNEGFESWRRGFCLNLDGQDFQDERDKGFWGWGKYLECAKRRNEVFESWRRGTGGRGFLITKERKKANDAKKLIFSELMILAEYRFYDGKRRSQYHYVKREECDPAEFAFFGFEEITLYSFLDGFLLSIGVFNGSVWRGAPKSEKFLLCIRLKIPLLEKEIA